jgi:hypothetical protein
VNRQLAQWMLFVAMVFTVPVMFFLVQVVLVAPLAAVIFVSIRSGTTGFLIFGAVHTVIFGALLFLAARLVAGVLEHIPKRNVRLLAQLGVIAFLMFVASLGPYSVGGHSNDQTYTWLHTFHPY